MHNEAIALIELAEQMFIAGVTIAPLAFVFARKRGWL